jgi:hypothetical protein
MFLAYIEHVLSGCCICLQWLSSVLDVCYKCFRCMLQVFHLDVAKVDVNRTTGDETEAKHGRRRRPSMAEDRARHGDSDAWGKGHGRA